MTACATRSPSRRLFPISEPFCRQYDGLPADRLRSQSTDALGESEGPEPRSEPADLRAADDGGPDRELAYYRTDDRQLVDGVREPGDGARDHRAVRRNGLRRGPAAARDRHPHGARG